MVKKPARIKATLQQVKDAVRRFELQNKGIARTVLVKNGHGIDFELLIPFLGGVPEDNFYMSRETYEIFEEIDRDIPKYLDIVQRAVDNYIYDHQKKPLVPSDFNQKVNTNLLVNHSYLEEVPPMDFYLTNQEDLITHKRPD